MTKDTELLFKRFENLTANAWVTDQRESVSDRKLQEVWDKHREARQALIKRIEELEQCLANDSAHKSPQTTT